MNIVAPEVLNLHTKGLVRQRHGHRVDNWPPAIIAGVEAALEAAHEKGWKDDAERHRIITALQEQATAHYPAWDALEEKVAPKPKRKPKGEGE